MQRNWTSLAGREAGPQSVWTPLVALDFLIILLVIVLELFRRDSVNNSQCLTLSDGILIYFRKWALYLNCTKSRSTDDTCRWLLTTWPSKERLNHSTDLLLKRILLRFKKWVSRQQCTFYVMLLLKVCQFSSHYLIHFLFRLCVHFMKWCRVTFIHSHRRTYKYCVQLCLMWQLKHECCCCCWYSISWRAELTVEVACD